MATESSFGRVVQMRREGGETFAPHASIVVLPLLLAAAAGWVASAQIATGWRMNPFPAPALHESRGGEHIESWRSVKRRRALAVTRSPETVPGVRF